MVIAGSIAVLALIAVYAYGNGVPGVAMSLVLGLVPLAIVMAPVVWVDRWEPEPRLLLVAAFLWGGGAVMVAVLFDPLVGRAIGSVVAPGLDALLQTMIFGAPVVEEFCKGLGVLLIFLVRRRQFNGPVDGIVYASVIAAAFAFVENITYFSTGQDLAVTFVVRGLLSPFVHLMCTACIGVALGLASRHRSTLAWLWTLPLGFLGAILLHGGWNGAAMFAGGPGGLGGLAAAVVFLNWVPLVIWAIIVVWLRNKERRLIGERLSEYVPSGHLVLQEVAMLTSMQGRRQARVWATRGGPQALAAMKSFQKAAVNLAYARQDLYTGHTGIRARQDEMALLETIWRTRAQFTTALGV